MQSVTYVNMPSRHVQGCNETALKQNMPKDCNLVIHIFVVNLGVEGLNWQVVCVVHLQSRAHVQEEITTNALMKKVGRLLRINHC